MKKLLFALLFSACLIGVGRASAVDWYLDFADGGAMATQWSGATVYSYLTLVPSATADAMSPETFMASWSKDFASTATEIAGDSIQYVAGSTVNSMTGSVGGWTEGARVGPWAGYLILVLVDDAGNAIYSSYGSADALTGDVLKARDDGTSWNQGDIAIAFGDASTWTAIDGAPEPTVLALLALGIAGLALKRKTA